MKKIDSKRKEEFLSEMLDFGFENNLEFLGYVKDEKGWSYITEETETEEEKEELYSSFVIF